MTSDLGPGTSDVVWDSESPAATQRIGEALGRLLEPGDVLALFGELGSGKTVFVRGVATGLGCRPADVHSPSFTLVNEYAGAGAAPGRPGLAHIDLYRLRSAEELPGIGWDEYLRSARVVAVEWAECAEGWLPGDHVRVALEACGASRRRIAGTGTGPRSSRLVRAWARVVRGER